MSLMDKFKKASKQVVDAGAKTMLKTDIMFLDRDIKARKQQFGIEIYDLMADLESNDAMPTEEKEAKIRQSFDAARKDIAVIQAKKECKKEEVAVLDSAAEGGAGATNDIPPSSGTVLTNTHPQDAEMEQM
uniref:Tubulin-specific chaperone A n=1 Tax=Craspedostauros australis TaxID=1486917 RepID=A0A6T6HF09_9STRA|mmetsp:Transcript_2730/g.7592  ORF Transcript_2730/g.7592 Transcript_2730/m.7592 type:complete len:131 (+) Transcript_2730:1162-1554(+)|eukprot:CAMPEP_0198134960 /NCGR_PEP_ID=MMETSP1442-20131203/60346_1 /TAXON_ID= /ORGANISM="Craspedostauros australis, Strain CCMP3328" /LENGTH=130 /DNA_ID=CAMNT_0043796121 /DNA_START=1470 /DNA_END=1862 /DNA_ORIENTATION=+